ncbi:MAG: hypothetical protein EPN34_06095 [Burkholderiaceae bacterium]|nr:MAG: hypothetical protein EPN34_06095 [Burkholderiaceae bacterium]
MNYWITKPETVLERMGERFGLLRVDHPQALPELRQTGFVWTQQQGVVCLAINLKYMQLALENRSVRAIIVPPEVAVQAPVTPKALIVCDKAEELYLYLHTLQQQTLVSAETPLIDPSATIDPSAILLGRIRIETDVCVGPHVSIIGPIRIGHGTRIEAGAIIGCDGLYAKSILGRRQHIPHFGGVEIGPSSHIHAGAIIVRSAIRGEATKIGGSTHIGIMANIGHDVTIGEAATLSSHCVIAGRARIGARAWIGASATISNALTIGNDARVRLGAVVVRDVPNGEDVSGNFATNHISNLRQLSESRNS